MKRIDLYIKDSQEEAIAEILQDSEAMTKSNIVRDALDEYIKKYNKNKKEKGNE